MRRTESPLLRIRPVSLASLFVALWLPSAASAQGWIIAGDHPVPDHRILPRRHAMPRLALREVEVKAEIEEFIARVEIAATFFNPHGRDLEGEYYFPLPREAQVEDFRARLGGKELSGEVLTADRAAEIYAEFVRRSVDPAILEYFQSGLFRARVFPIPAQGDVRISLGYRQILRASGGSRRFHCPLGSGRILDAGSGTLRVEVTLSTEQDLKSISSPSHAIRVEERGPRHARILLSGAAPTFRDFVLDWISGGDGLAGGVRACAEPGGDGYFVLRLAPGARPTRERPPVSMIFVVDVSGSMATGGKIENARAALATALARFGERDRFEILAFSGRVQALFGGLASATRDNLALARGFVDGLVARGGTDIGSALEAALACGRGADTGTILLLSDGAPTVGVTDAPALVDLAAKSNRGDFRVHVFGIGEDVNPVLLDDLARRNGGSRNYLRTGENLELALAALLDKVLEPCLTGIAIDGDGIELASVEPAGPHDLFYGEDLVVAGRYRGQGAACVRVAGSLGAERRTFLYPADFPRSGGDPDAALVWAQFRILRLLDELRAAPERERGALEREVVSLGLRFGIVTPYTSYLVQEQGPRPLADGFRERLRRSAGAKQDVDEERAGFGAAGGESAFGYSERKAERDARAARGEVALDADAAGFARELDIRVHGGRAFVPIDGLLVDGSLEGAELPRADRELVYGSDEYLEFLRRNPGAAALLAAGRNLLFRWEGQVIRIREDAAAPESQLPGGDSREL